MNTLSTTHIERYEQWLRTLPTVPVFMEKWWLEAVCAGSDWDVLLATDEEGTIIAAMPYLLYEKGPMKWIEMPKRTPIGGILIDEKIAADKWLITQACQQIEKQLTQLHLCYYHQRYPMQSFAVEAMHSLGYRKRTHSINQMDFLGDLEQIINQFAPNKKRQLQKSMLLRVEQDMLVERFYQFYVECTNQQHQLIQFSREFMLLIHRKSQRQQCCRIISIHTDEEELCAAAFVVWDKQSLYYLIPCNNLRYKDSGASTLLVLEAIKLAREKHLSFVFGDSTNRDMQAFYSQFGGTPTPYCAIEKLYNPLFLPVLWYQRIRSYIHKYAPSQI